MSRALLAAMMALAATAPVEPAPRRLLPKPRPKSPAEPLSVPCPRCHAAPGEDCDRRSLGAHRYHMARVRAWEER